MRFRFRYVALVLIVSNVQAERLPSLALEQGALQLVTQQQTSGDMEFYFPDWIDGEDWSVQLTLTNLSTTTEAQARIITRSQTGGSVTVFGREQASAVRIPALGSRTLRSPGVGSIRRGWIKVEANSGSVGGLLTYRHGQSGIEVGVEPVEQGKRFALFVEETTDIGTGIAIFRESRPPEIEFAISNEDGEDLLDGDVIVWDDFYQSARTIPEWLKVGGDGPSLPRDFRGLVFLRSDSPFGAVGLRFGKVKTALSAVPLIRLPDEADCPAPNPFGGCGPTDPPPSPDRPAAPTVSAVQGTSEEMEISFRDSFRANETKAYDVQVRTKSPRGNWTEGCATVTNPRNSAVTATAVITATGLKSDTVYEARYRHRNSSRCDGGTPGEWSEIGEGRTGSAGTPSVPTVSLSASPSSIERGQSATLRWSSTNAASASITPGIGTVPTSGSRQVSPTSTTTYRITVRNADGQTAMDTATVTVTDPPPDDADDFKKLTGFRVRNDGGITLSVGGITLSVGKSGCISGGGTFNGQLWDYHQTWWQRNTGSGWQEVSGTKKSGRLCGYDLGSASSGTYRAVGDMTVAGTRGKYKSENEVSN